MLAIKKEVRSASDIGADWDQQMEDSLKRTADQHDNHVASLMTLMMFMVTYELFQGLPLGDLEKIGIRQRSRHDIHDKEQGEDTPWHFSPEGWAEGQTVNTVFNLLKEEGLNLQQLKDAMAKNLLPGDKSLNLALNNSEIIGQFGYHEAAIQGELEALMFHDLGIPWTTCEDNNNCSTPGEVCPDCMAESGNIYAIDMFPESMHDFCRCNEPMADPVPMNGADLLWNLKSIKRKVTAVIKFIRG